MKRKNYFADVEKRWMRCHIGAMTVATCLQLTAELVMMFIFYETSVNQRSATSYMTTYVILPSGMNVLTILANLIIVYKTSLSHRMKCIILSLSFFLCIFIVTSVHNIFSSMFLVFAVPLILTTAYHSQLITGLGAGLGVVLMVLSKLLFADANPETCAQSFYLINFIMDIVVFLAIYIVCIFLIIHNRREQTHALSIRTEADILKDRSASDSLTGLKNQASFKSRLSQLALGDDKHFILAAVDVSNLNLINDKYGHMVGDEFIRQFAQLLHANCINGEIYRYCGDMFCIIFSSNDPKSIIFSLNHMRAVFLNFAKKNYNEFGLDLNVGLASSYGMLSGKEVFENADKALVQAKKSETDNVVFFKK